jgi:hypothetical protein
MRRSKLTNTQWEEIERRLVFYESCRALGREFGISEAAIRKRLSTQVKEMQALASSMIAWQRSIEKFDLSTQISIIKGLEKSLGRPVAYLRWDYV